MTEKIAIVVRGGFGWADSIGNDAISQYRTLSSFSRTPAEVRIFAETVPHDRDPAIPVEPIGALTAWAGRDRDITIIYHWCDSWPGFDRWLPEVNARVIIRWHNNTPPWFFARYSTIAVANTVRGFRGILTLATAAQFEFWANSAYSARQLAVLGIAAGRVRVVYPASAYLEAPYPEAPRQAPAPAGPADRPVRLLFVGRVVPHKGHKHLIAAAALLKPGLRREVELILPGRFEPVSGYVAELKDLARLAGVRLVLRGEVSRDALAALYTGCDVFVCLSEHEGFGLPVFEAMRMGLPVVGLRSTAFSEFLRGHPLAADEMDYVKIAARIIAALDPAIREPVLGWQRAHLGEFYSAAIVRRQITGALAGQPEIPAPAIPADAALNARVAATAAAWEAKLRPAFDRMPPLHGIPADTIDRYVTRHDIEAFERFCPAEPTSALFGNVMATRFGSARPVIGPVLRLARRLALSLHSGLLTGLSIMDGRISHRFDSLEHSVAILQASLDDLRGSRQGLNEAPAPCPACGATAAPDCPGKPGATPDSADAPVAGEPPAQLFPRRKTG